MKPIYFVMSGVLAASVATGAVLAQVPAGEVEQQVPVVEGVERPDSPSADQAQGNAEVRVPQAVPGGDVQQPPPVEVPAAPGQPVPQQD